VTESGVYLENCKYVRYGFHGSLEVFSQRAAGTYATHVEDCLRTLHWTRARLGGFPYLGEDTFAQQCMDRFGVDRVPSQYQPNQASGGLHAAGACSARRPAGIVAEGSWSPDCKSTRAAALHAYKDPRSYFRCLVETQS